MFATSAGSPLLTHTWPAAPRIMQIIQLGLTLTDAKGNTPPGVCTWQFNFRFSLGEDMYAQDSIDLLTRSGINFARHEVRGFAAGRWLLGVVVVVALFCGVVVVVDRTTRGSGSRDAADACPCVGSFPATTIGLSTVILTTTMEPTLAFNDAGDGH